MKKIFLLTFLTFIMTGCGISDSTQSTTSTSDSTSTSTSGSTSSTSTVSENPLSGTWASNCTDAGSGSFLKQSITIGTTTSLQLVIRFYTDSACTSNTYLIDAIGTIIVGNLTTVSGYSKVYKVDSVVTSVNLTINNSTYTDLVNTSKSFGNYTFTTGVATDVSASTVFSSMFRTAYSLIAIEGNYVYSGTNATTSDNATSNALRHTAISASSRLTKQ